LKFFLETLRVQNQTGLMQFDVLLFALTHACSAELKRALLHETLDKHFTFVDVRMSQVSGELSKLINGHKFMDMDPQSDETIKKSTFLRWQDQVSECTLRGIRTLCHFIRFR
jgi:hypothetical protein